jgi:hypothetical protein
MSTTIDTLLANEHIADLRRAADRRRPASDSADLYASAIELRLLCAHEAYLVGRLAQLDDAPELGGQVLIALIGGQAVAALSLDDQRVVANPFIPTSEAVALLHLRAKQLAKAERRPPRLRRLRLAASR